jgi:hypothetical protein
MRRTNALGWLALVSLVCLSSGCRQELPTGSAVLVASLTQEPSASEVTRVTVTLSAEGLPARSTELELVEGQWRGAFQDIPAGNNRTFSAQAFDASGTKRFEGQATGISITAGQTVAVSLLLQEVATAPFENTVPVIDALNVSASSVLPGGSLELQVNAHDPNPGDTLTYAWTATAGTFSSSTSTTPTWTAPQRQGPVTLTVRVTDSRGASASLDANVQVRSNTGGVDVDVRFNSAPVVEGLTASPSRVDVGQATTVSVSARDSAGDVLASQWSAQGCEGSWTDATQSSARFTPSALPSGEACGSCRLTVTVSDGRGGQAVGALSLCVGSQPEPVFPFELTASSQSAATVSPGATVTLRVSAWDRQGGGTLGFSWAAGSGTLGTPVSGPTVSEVSWKAPACLPGGATASITATVRNAQEQTLTRTFLVDILPGCVAWNYTSNMTRNRTRHTATLLPSGKVLVSGGIGLRFANAERSTEVYDPATWTWTATGSMAMFREKHTATLLPSGRVLVTGGAHINGTTNGAEVYDPVAGTWSATGSLATARNSHTATLLPSGQVLVAGGGSSSGHWTSAELYDPATGTWSATGSMGMSRAAHTATRLPDGKVLVVGGNSDDFNGSAELYDPATGTWSATGSMATARRNHTATLLPSGKVLVTGGQNTYVNPASSSELYDPATGTWSPTGSLATARTRHTATLLPSGKVLVSGGSERSGGSLASAEVYDPTPGTWSSVADMPEARYDFTATLLPSGQVLVSGGWSPVTTYMISAHIFTP